MEHFAGDVLDAYGADDAAAEEVKKVEFVDEESIFLVELPSASIDESLGAARSLKLRVDPNEPELTGVAQVAQVVDAACGCTPSRGDGDESGFSALRCARGIVPMVAWLPRTTFASLKADVVAGVTVATMVIPQSMSYATIAGLSEVYGLYASTVPAIMYAIFGASGQLAVGPVAMVSLLVEAGLSGKLPRGACPEFYDDDDDDDNGARRLSGGKSVGETCPKAYAELVMVCMFFVGVMQVAGALCRLGFLINFLGHPVVSGFTSGAAVTIGLSQLKYWLGVDVAKSQYVYETVGALWNGVVEKGELKYMNLVLGLASYGLLWAMKTASVKQPKRYGFLKPISALIVCFVSTAVMLLFPVLKHEYNVEVIGSIPNGVPPFSLDEVLGNLSKYGSTVLPTAFSVALIGFMESIAIGKNLAAKHGTELPAGREMGAIGLANLVGSCFSGYPVAGSFSRSAIANSTGARTPLAGLITGLIVIIFLIQLPTVIYQLPKFVLATIVISSVVNLFDAKEARHLWHLKKADFGLWVAAFLGVLFLGVETGLAIAIGMSLIIVIAESSSPQISVLWKLPGTTIYRNVKQGETAGQFIRGILIVRVGASMYFANVAYVKDRLSQLARDFGAVLDDSGKKQHDTATTTTTGGQTTHGGHAVEYVVLEMTPVMTLDSTAIHMIQDLCLDFAKRGVRVCLCSLSSRVEESLRLAGVQKRVGYEWFHDNVQAAVEWCVRHQAAKRTLQLRLTAKLLDHTTMGDSTDHPHQGGGDDDGAFTDVEARADPSPSSSSSNGGGGGGGGVELTDHTATTNQPVVRQRKSALAKSASKDGMNNVNNDDDDDAVPLLVLAGKHRVVDTKYDQYREAGVDILQLPEKRALRHAQRVASPPGGWARAVEPSAVLAHDSQGGGGLVTATNNALLDDAQKRETIDKVRRGLRSFDPTVLVSTGDELAPPRVVAQPDARDPTLLVEVAVDVADRPGLLRDISDALLRHLQVTLRHSEAAVVNQRSLSIWRCEVAHRGLANVTAAVAKAETLLPDALR